MRVTGWNGEEIILPWKVVDPTGFYDPEGTMYYDTREKCEQYKTNVWNAYKLDFEIRYVGSDGE
jgi:hypothetical protein